jgi:hypothetical protein
MAGAGAWRGLCPRGPIHSFNYHSRLEKKNLGGMDTWLCDLFTYPIITGHYYYILGHYYYILDSMDIYPFGSRSRGPYGSILAWCAGGDATLRPGVEPVPWPDFPDALGNHNNDSLLLHRDQGAKPLTPNPKP